MQAARCPPAEWPLTTSCPEASPVRASPPHLPDDVGDRNLRAEIVGRNRDVDAMGVEAARHMAEARTIQRLPIAAVNEDDERRFALPLTGKEIDHVARARAVGDPRAARAARDRRPHPCAQPAISAGFSGTRARLLYSTS